MTARLSCGANLILLTAKSHFPDKKKESANSRWFKQVLKLVNKGLGSVDFDPEQLHSCKMVCTSPAFLGIHQTKGQMVFKLSPCACTVDTVVQGQVLSYFKSTEDLQTALRNQDPREE